MRNWKKASENRTLSLSTDTHVSSLAQAPGRNTTALDKFEPTYTPSQIEWAQGLAKEGPKGVLALHEHTWNDFRREHVELQDPGDSATTTLYREEAQADSARTVKQLRRAPARRSCPPWSIPGRLWLLLMWPTFLRKGKRRIDALGYKPPAGSQLLETRHAITSCLEAMRRCDAASVVSSRSLGWVIPKPGKVGFESCRLVHGMCDFWKAWHRGLFLEGTWPELPSYCCGFQRARRREGAVASHLALAARCRHESISFVDESLDMANAFGSLDRKNTEDVIQPRLKEIDRFFFVTRGRRLFTEVLAPDGIASGLAQVGLFMGDRNAPDEFGAVFQVRLTRGKRRSPKRMAEYLGAVRTRTSSAHVGSHCSQTMFLKRVCWSWAHRTNVNTRRQRGWAR